jgi:hypothetical protein
MSELSHQDLERAFKPATEAISRLPESVEKREAKRLLAAAEQVAHIGRERRPETQEE